MRLVIHNTHDHVSSWAAKYIRNKIKKFKPDENKYFVLGLPTGGTPLGMYKELIRMHQIGEISFKYVKTFNMDEYVGLPRDHPESYHYYMWSNFFKHIDIDPKNVNLLDGNAEDLCFECDRYEQEIKKAGGINLFVGGIGPDGHIAFNEPGSSLVSRTRVKTLAMETVVANSRFFDDDISKVPKMACTVGVGTVMDAEEVMVLITGQAKAFALHKAIEDGISHMWTVSAFQQHPHTIFVCDEEATNELKVKTVKYFKGLMDLYNDLVEDLDDNGKSIKGNEKKLQNTKYKINKTNEAQLVSSNTWEMSYKYTVNHGFLTHAQRDFYERNGFLVVRKLIPQNELDKYHQRFVDICHKRVGSTGAMTIMKDVVLKNKQDVDPERVINKIQDYQGDPVLSSYFHFPEILKYVECFTGKDVSAVHTMLINKPPDPGTKSSRHPLHQDLYYFPFRPTDRIVCSWTAMQKVHRDNGCLVVVPGTHIGHLLAHGYPQWSGGVNKMYHGILDYEVDEKKLVYLEMEPGDTVFFHPILIHGSGSNRTAGFRKAISCHFSTSHSYYIDVKGTVQEELSKEVVQVAEKRYPSGEWNYKMIWDAKRVVLQGRDPIKSAL